MSGPLFFFSYARSTYQNAEGTRFTAAERRAINSIDEFYKMLCQEVADNLAGKSANEVGFFDQEDLELAASWPVRLVEALGSAAVMVALFTPTYFSRRACGREFEVFRRRHRALEQSAGRALDHRILPVLWTRPDQIHGSIPDCCREEIRNLQLTPPGAPTSYGTFGLKQIFNNENRVEWNKVCDLIAERILKLSQADTLPALTDVDFGNLPSAFHEEPEFPGDPRPIVPGKREIRVYYLVPTRREWSEVTGTKGSDFDDRRELARPFIDARDVNVARATEEGAAAIKPDLGVSHEPLPRSITQALKSAEGTMTTPLLVLDRRALRIPALGVAAAAYAKGKFDNTGLVTVAGGDMQESDINALSPEIAEALPTLQIWNAPDRCSEYTVKVATVVAGLEMQLIQRQVNRLTPSPNAIPGLSGPGGI